MIETLQSLFDPTRDRPEIRRQEREEEAEWQAQRRELQNFLKDITAAA